MEELIDYLHRQKHAQVWARTNAEKADPIEITEIWESIDPAGEPRVEQIKIEASKLEHWLNTTRPEPRDPSSFRFQCSLRIVWVKIARDQHVHYMSKEQIDTVVKAFKLELAYKYYGTSGAGATEISRSHGSCTPSQYAFSYRPKLAAIWTRKVESNTIEAIFFTVEGYINSFEPLLKERWRMFDQEMFIPFLCSAMIGLRVDELSNKINEDIREIEEQTGFHGWSNNERKVAPDDLETLFQKVGVMSTKTASALQKLRIITRLNHFALERLDRPVSREALRNDNRLPNDDVEGKDPPVALDDRQTMILYSSPAAGLELCAVEDEGGALGDDTKRHNVWVNARSERQDRLRSVIGLLENRAHEQHIRVEYLQQRVQLQIQVIENVIDHLDNLTALAQAEVSNRIASASHQETFSMKALAMVSMAFLPATFVAACFDLPLFDWHSSEISGIVSLRILVFVLVAVVLTGFVFLIYWRWMLSQRKERARDAEHIPWRVGDDKGTTVIKNVVETRRWVSRRAYRQQSV